MWSPSQLRSVSEDIASAFTPGASLPGAALFPVDPHRIFVVWATVEPWIGRPRRARLVLRLRRRGARTAWFTQPLDVKALKGGLYLDAPPEGGRWAAEVGWLTAQGRFEPLLRSDWVALSGFRVEDEGGKGAPLEASEPASQVEAGRETSASNAVESSWAAPESGSGFGRDAA